MNALVFAETMSARPNALSEIISAVAAVFAIEPADIIGRQRTKSIAEARMLVCLLARRCTRLSFPEVGVVLGARHHTTVMSLADSAERQCRKDQWFAVTAAELLERFGAEEEVTRQ